MRPNIKNARQLIESGLQRGDPVMVVTGDLDTRDAVFLEPVVNRKGEVVAVNLDVIGDVHEIPLPKLDEFRPVPPDLLSNASKDRLVSDLLTKLGRA